MAGHVAPAEKRAESAAGGDAVRFRSPNHDETSRYFARLRLRLKLGLTAAVVGPALVLSAYFHFQFDRTLRESGKLHLSALAESQRNTVDLFLQERVVNIFSLFRGRGFSLAPTQQDMSQYLASLRQVSDAFIDVGFFDSRGVQIGYTGPFPYLHGKDYSNEAWFRALMEQERNYHISDIYLGFRGKPHFTIAVKQIMDGQPYAMRATLDPDKFYMFLRSISRGKGVESMIVSAEGRYQVVDPDRGELFAMAEYVPPPDERSGVSVIENAGGSVLVAYTELRETSWRLLTRQPLNIAYAEMYKTRNYMLGGTAVLVIGMALAIHVFTEGLLGRAEETALAREDLTWQLQHASKLASVGELAAGVAHEINNPLAIIGATTGVVRDMIDPAFSQQWSLDEIRTELDNIDTAVFRARGITSKLLNYARRNEPRPIMANINRVLDDVVGGIKEKEFEVADIKLVRDYDLDLPRVLVDPDQLAQVFLNLINNAGDAIVGPGTITLSTRRDGDKLVASVTDSGSGMTPEQMRNIFLPFYTTKEVGKGTGLGLSVSLGIVESLGGSISVQSVPGGGSSFMVELPLGKTGEVGNGDRS